MSRELRFDFPRLEIGIAEYDDGPTGCTVFRLPPGGAACAQDVRGGSPGTLGDGYEWAHAGPLRRWIATGWRPRAASLPS